MLIPFDIFESAQAAHVKCIQSIVITDGQVPSFRSIATQRRPCSEVISASMEPSAEMIEPRYVNEGTNSTSSPSMFIGG